MQLSNVYANKVLDWILGGNRHPDTTAVVKVALLKSAPNVNGSYTQVTGGGYSAVGVLNDATRWPNAANRQKTNGQTVDFGTVSGSPYDAPATHWALLDNNDVLITAAALSVPFAGNLGDSADFPPGALVTNSPAS